MCEKIVPMTALYRRNFIMTTYNFFACTNFHNDITLHTISIIFQSNAKMFYTLF